MSILWFLLTLFSVVASAAGGAFVMRWYLERNREIAEQEDPRDTQIRELQTALKVARDDASRARDASETDQGRLEQAQASVEELEQRVTQAKQQYATCKEVLKNEISHKNDIRDELEATRKELNEVKEQFQELELELSVQHGAGPMLDPGAVQRPVAGTGVEAEEDDLDDPGPAPDEDSSPSLITSLSSELERWKKHCHVLGEELKHQREHGDTGTVLMSNGGSPVINNNDPADELTAIRGIGNVLERKLHQLGIYHYRELVGLSPESLKQISVLIPDFKARMRRFDWVDQARQLHRKKYHEAI